MRPIMAFSGGEVMPPDAVNSIQQKFAAALSEWLEHRRPVLVSVTLPIRVTTQMCMRIAGSRTEEFRFLWRDPQGESIRLGLGAAERFPLQGDGRFLSAKRQLMDIRRSWQLVGDSSPPWITGFSFSEGTSNELWRQWSPGLLVLPTFWVEVRSDGSATVTITRKVDGPFDADDVTAQLTGEFEAAWKSASTDTQMWREGGDERSHEVTDEAGHQVLSVQAIPPSMGTARPEWRENVERVSVDIRDRLYEKVVIARRSVEDIGDAADLYPVLQSLDQLYPDSFLFAIWNEGECFLGATPERLVRVSHGVVQVDCLAGTTSRGDSAELDERLGSELLHSPKNRLEHDVVVRWVRMNVGDMLTAVEIPDTPVLRKLANVQHLYTPLTGQLIDGVSVLDLVARLHPTPAVAGVPRDDALAVIRQRESMERGWYAGTVGWMDWHGDGDFAVALRCALITGHQAHLFAGGGIMGDSDPDSEWDETELKLRPMRTALRQLTQRSDDAI